MTEAERLINHQLDSTKHAVKGGRFDRFTGRRISRPVNSKYDETGLLRLEYPSKRRTER